MQRLARGATQAGGQSSLTLPAVAVTGGGLLVAVAGVLGATGGVTLTYRGRVLVPDAQAVVPSGGVLAGSVYVFSDRYSGGKSGDLVLHAAGGVPATLTLQAVQVAGLGAGVPDQVLQVQGQATLPDTGTTPVLTSAPQYAQSAFLLVAPGAWFWQSGFNSGGQDLSPTVQGSATGATEGYRVVVGASPVRAALVSTVPAWAGILVTYR